VRILFLVTFLICTMGCPAVRAQSMEDLNLQVHGFATQGFIYTTHDNWNTADTTHGSTAWTEAVINISAQPQARVRVGMQARYYLLGDYGNSITMDWAQADIKLNEHFGLRGGKVKTPAGLLNDSQDIDPAQLWIILPQSVYPLAGRDSLLSHYGGVAYGTVALGERMGKLEYHGFAGTRILSGSDSFFQSMRDGGLTLPNGLTGPVYGATLKWRPPIPGLMLGVSDQFEQPAGEAAAGPLHGTFTNARMNIPYFFGRYENMRMMFAGEYNRIPPRATLVLGGMQLPLFQLDIRAFYLMTSFKVSTKLTAGLYYSSLVDRKAAFNSMRYEKDWAVSARYDFNPFLYLKLEQHFMDGTEIGFPSSDNPNPQAGTRMFMAKLGVNF
jgi:hypothetical protein